MRAGFTARGDLVGDPTESLGSLWYHDHHLDFTAQNVYKGMFGCYNLFDELDTGEEGKGLNLPCKDYDIPIFFHDALFDSTCQTVFDLFNLDGILGDRFLANGAIQPYLNVQKRRYRFRLYAPGPSRWWEWSLWDGTKFLPFWQISTDGNLLPNAVQVTSVRIAVAERVDIIVDFSKIKSSRTYFVNRAEQVNGRGPTGKTLSPGTPVLQVKRPKLWVTCASARVARSDYTDFCCSYRDGVKNLIGRPPLSWCRRRQHSLRLSEQGTPQPMSIDARLEELKQDLAQQLQRLENKAAGAQARGREADHPGEIPPRGWKDILWRAWAEISDQNLFLIAGGVTYAVLLALFPGWRRSFPLWPRLRYSPDREAGCGALRRSAGANAGAVEPGAAQSGGRLERRARLRCHRRSAAGALERVARHERTDHRDQYRL